MKYKLLSVLALICGPVVIFTGIEKMKLRERIEKEGIEMMATAVSKEESGRRGKTRKITVAFSPKGQGLTQATAEVSKTLYENIDSQPMIKIKFLAEDPAKIIFVGESGSDGVGAVAGGIITAVGAFGVWWHFMRKKKPTESEPAAAPVQP